MNKLTYLIAGAVILLLGIGTALWWQRQPQPAPTTASPPAAASSASVAVEPAAPPPAAVASTPLIAHPIDAPASAAASSGPPSIEAALADLFGRKTMLSMFQTDDFAHRLVATVDNLGRTHAPARLWPINPSDGRLVVERHDGDEVIGSDNGLRYTPFVLLVETVDLRKAVALYTQLYPQLQQAYADVGFPKRYFNDRLVEVIDLLLATPELDGAPKVRLPQINGPRQPARPWVLYEFEDPALQALPSGQKILLRMGPVNERRMKAKLTELRELLTPGQTTR